MVINGTFIKPGSHRLIDINIARLPSHTLIELPVLVYRSKKPGPTLLLSAGVHGDEINGIEIIRRLIRRKVLMPDIGAVIAIPLVNIYGFIHNSRSLPDGKDLNRCFPGTSSGSLANRIAYIIMNEIIPVIDYGVDFHTGGSRITNFPQVRAVMNEPMNRELAKAFATRFIVNSNFIEKSFRKEAQKAGKSILVYEGGESLRLDELAIQEGLDGVQRLMQHLGMKQGPELPSQESLILKESNWLRAKISGIFISKIVYGQHVQAGQVVAVISDPFGKTRITIKCPVDGYIIGVNNMPVVSAGDALMHIGTISE